MRHRNAKSTLFALWVVIVASAGVRSASAQDARNWNQEHDPYVGALGLAAGFTSGTGLAVRWPALPQTMMGVAGGAWGSSSELAWNVGFELHYVLRQVGRTRLFIGPAVAFISDDSDDETDVNASFDFGLERLLRPRISLKLDVGFTYLGEKETVYPLPQIGLFYYF